MEHRYATRFDIAINVWVYCPDGLILRGNTRNICVDGSFIELTQCRIDRNSMVEVVYLQDGKFSERRKAIVVHANSDGIGLMFEVSSKALHEYTLQFIGRRAQIQRHRADVWYRFFEGAVSWRIYASSRH